MFLSLFHNFSFTVSYRCFISCLFFLICFSRSLSVASTLSDICCRFSSVALVRLKQLSRFSFLLYRISLFSYCRSYSLHFNFLSICSNVAVNLPSSRENFVSWLSVGPRLTCSLSCLGSIVIAETVPNVLLFSVVGTTSSFSLGFIPTTAAILSVNDVLFV